MIRPRFHSSSFTKCNSLLRCELDILQQDDPGNSRSPSKLRRAFSKSPKTLSKSSTWRFRCARTQLGSDRFHKQLQSDEINPKCAALCRYLTDPDKMALKTTGAGVTLTTRFKRKRKANVTPPATPFNNTSFLIQLQRRREQRRIPTRCEFDQYGSMENMIAWCYLPTSPQNRIPGPSSHSIPHPATNPSSQTPQNPVPSRENQDGEVFNLNHPRQQQQEQQPCSGDPQTSPTTSKLEDSQVNPPDC